MRNPLRRETLTEQVLYTPFDLSDATPAGRRRFWKQVLPNTTITYKGQKIKFDKRFHMDLADSFKKEAFDQVPIVFADGENKHNMDPRNFGGDVLDMQVRPQGLFALIEADKDAAKAIEKNPKLGVSARIRQMVEKADGRTFPRAIEHICLTMNPRVTGMSPWEAAVDLSDEDADIEVVDLTAENYEEGSDMGVKRTKKAASSKAKGPIDLSTLDDEQFQSLLDLAEALKERGVDEDEDLEEVEGEGEDEGEDEPVRKTRRKKSRTKITVDKESEDDGDGDEGEGDEVDADLTDEDAERVIRSTERSQFQQMRFDLAERSWNTERDEFAAAGVPPFLLDLAEPFLALPDPVTIDLSDDEDPLDATDAMRKMLEGVQGIVDLTDEFGHQFDLTADEATKTETDLALEKWDAQNYG